MIKIGAAIIFAIQVAVFILVAWAIYTTLTEPQAVATAIGEFFGTIISIVKESAS